MPNRVYTTLDDVVVEAMTLVVDVGLVAEDASAASKLHTLVEVANDKLRSDHEREEKIAAYEELALDADRAQAIRESNLAAVAAGIL